MSTLKATGNHFPQTFEVNRTRRKKIPLGRIYLSRQEVAIEIREKREFSRDRRSTGMRQII